MARKNKKTKMDIFAILKNFCIWIKISMDLFYGALRTQGFFPSVSPVWIHIIFFFDDLFIDGIKAVVEKARAVHDAIIGRSVIFVGISATGIKTVKPIIPFGYLVPLLASVDFAGISTIIVRQMVS